MLSVCLSMVLVVAANLQIEAWANEPQETRPVIQCEYSHEMGNSNGNYREYWDAFERHPYLQVPCHMTPLKGLKTALIYSSGMTAALAPDRQLRTAFSWRQAECSDPIGRVMPPHFVSTSPMRAIRAFSRS